MFVIAPNSFIWTGACGERNKDSLLKNKNKLKDELLLHTVILRQYTVEETHLVVFPVQCVLCDFFSKFRIDLDLRRLKRSHFSVDKEILFGW